jgi:hypothetical protein
MFVVFKIAPDSHRRQRIEYIRQRAEGCFSKHTVTIEEDGFYVTVTVRPEPPFSGDISRYAVFAAEAKNAVYWEWPENSN